MTRSTQCKYGGCRIRQKTRSRRNKERRDLQMNSFGTQTDPIPATFCGKCGSRLVIKEIFARVYDVESGRPNYFVELRCPKRHWWSFWSNHQIAYYQRKWNSSQWIKVSTFLDELFDSVQPGQRPQSKRRIDVQLFQKPEETYRGKPKVSRNAQRSREVL